MLSHSSKEEWNILTPLELLSHMNCEFCQATFKVIFFFSYAIVKIALTAGFS